ncbi:hypothetical protein KGF56_001375 [Candida oxycetoniae]|uniref:Uncharacterized protein n=1 Tax=Candida oxycetoniae TaxID=497107 RepID=A0AAI9WZ32_9ASCO|nr:uncharacterized protein KGF56_001375 [Candida oxycetoniae]KAI3405768.1 hypothetical protein KGF56_001375 [Candida oxycetoniae]
MTTTNKGNDSYISKSGKNSGSSNKKSSSSSGSRLRKLDKLVLDQSSSALLDEEDQIEYIKELSIYNQEQYSKRKRQLIYLYIIEIITITVISLKYRNAAADLDNLTSLLLLLNICLNIITTIEPPFQIRKLHKWITVISGLISLQIIWMDLTKKQVYYFAVLSSLNWSLPILFKYWFQEIGESVEDLNQLKYKYKSA